LIRQTSIWRPFDNKLPGLPSAKLVSWNRDQKSGANKPLAILDQRRGADNALTLGNIEFGL
jgi:hypothetical protein